MREQTAFTEVDARERRRQALSRNQVIRPGQYDADVENGEPDEQPYFEKRTGSSVRTTYRNTAAPYGVKTQPGQRIDIPPRRSAMPPTAPAPKRKRRSIFRSFRAHPLIWLGIGMVSMLILWTLLTILVNWWNVTQDDLHYGRPRTAQYHVVLGFDNDSAAHKTHVIVENLHSHIIIIVLPAGQVSKSMIYSGPWIYGQGSDLVPVTLTFEDTTGNGKLDMEVHFQGTIILYLNQGGKFVPQAQSQ